MGMNYCLRGDFTVRDCPESRDLIEKLQEVHGDIDLTENESPSVELACFSLFIDINCTMGDGSAIDRLMDEIEDHMPEPCDLIAGMGPDEETVWYGDPGMIEAAKAEARLGVARNAFAALDGPQQSKLLAELGLRALDPPAKADEREVPR